MSKKPYNFKKRIKLFLILAPISFAVFVGLTWLGVETGLSKGIFAVPSIWLGGIMAVLTVLFVCLVADFDKD